MKVDTDFGTWLREFKRLVEGAQCFPGARLKEEDLKQYVMDCLSQFPTIMVSHKERLESCATFKEMIAFLGRHSQSNLYKFTLKT